jgi:heme exporter protein A
VDFSSLRFVEVSRAFGRRRALNRVSLSAPAGTVTALLGHNGAGKSTLLSIAATLLRPTGGTVDYGGTSAEAGGKALRARIGLLGHDLSIYQELTAAENLRFFAKVYALDRIEARVDAALERAGLADRRDDVVGGFSRGMRQRLALERALLHAPRLVLFDEPFTGLDDRAVGIIADRLRRLAAGGAIVILATHDLDVADSLVTRVALIRGGRLLSDEPASPGLRARYRAMIGAS